MQGLTLYRCSECGTCFTEKDSWDNGDQCEWEKVFAPLTVDLCLESDADSERSAKPCVDDDAPPENSELSSSAEDRDTDGSDQDVPEAVATEALASNTPNDTAEPVDTIDEEALWADPNAWDYGLCVHQIYFTVHARKTLGVLLCSRVDEGQYLSVVNASSAWPVCRVCSAAKIRALVGAGCISPALDSPRSSQEPDEGEESGDDGETGDESIEATPH